LNWIRSAQLGLRIGARISEKLRERSEQATGIALIVVAIVLLRVRLLALWGANRREARVVKPLGDLAAAHNRTVRR
jgi:hypothetical protein